MKFLIRKAIPGLALAMAMVFSSAAVAQKGEGPLDKTQPAGITPEQIIQKFAAKEKEFSEARENYTWRQTVIVETLDGDTVDGEFKQVYDVLFDSKGRRTQQVVFAPQNTLERVTMTPSDFQDIENRLPFVMTTDDLPQYNVLYVGKQQEDELGTYVFDLAPKTMEKGKRYFQGRIWVDDHDFQIVKTQGLNVPQVHAKKAEDENLSPPFTTYREQVDGKYWFPTFTRADDTLHFRMNDVHIREIVKYENYKRYGANVKITYEGQEVPKGTDQGQQKQPPPK
jgi:outer membrane lipoprotein-sorting protein